MAAATPRQYRPTYTCIPPVVNPNGSQVPLTVTQPMPANCRRNTTSYFPVIDPLHSRPTVASSRLTASTSYNDFANPTSRRPRQSFLANSSTSHGRSSAFVFGDIDNLTHSAHCFHKVISGVDAKEKTATRIPTPIPVSHPLPQGQDASNLTVSFVHKEEIQQSTQRYHAPNENLPAVGNRTLTKSHTMNALNNVRSILTRSSHDLKALTVPKFTDSTSRKSLPGFKSSAQVITSRKSQPLPTFTTNVRQISTAMPSIYWAGRFTALYDRFRSEILSREDLLESPFFRRTLLEPNHISSQNYTNTARLDGMAKPSKTNKPFDYEASEHIKQAKRAFTHLEALCLTKESEKSLRSFRISYARLEGNSDLLPPGAKFLYDSDENHSFISKAGRIFSGSGRKSEFGMPLVTSKSKLV